MTIPLDPMGSIILKLKEIDREIEDAEVRRDQHRRDLVAVERHLDKLDGTRARYLEAAAVLKSLAVMPPEPTPV